MGLLSKVFNIGGVVQKIGGSLVQGAEVFKVNQTEKMKHDAARFQTAMSQFEGEFAQKHESRFERFVNALNRLPRPFLALGTIALFIFAMADPAGFTIRMNGLSAIPEPLWWLLGAIVGFYFGARELHHFRVERPKIRSIDAHEKAHSRGNNSKSHSGDRGIIPDPIPDPGDKGGAGRQAIEPSGNAAIDEWLQNG